MVHVVAECYVKVADQENYFGLAKELVEITRGEKGCVQYVLTQGIDNLDKIVCVEKWDTKEDLDNHLQAEHMKRILPKMKAMRYKQVDVVILNEVM